MLWSDDTVRAQVVERVQARMHEGETERLARSLRTVRRPRLIELPLVKGIRRFFEFRRFHLMEPKL